MLFQSEDWERRCRIILEEFNRAVQALFDAKDLARGGITGEDRRGNHTFFPITTLSAGAVAAEGREYVSAEEVASAAASAKRRAKQQGAGLVVLAQGLAAQPQPRTEAL